MQFNRFSFLSHLGLIYYVAAITPDRRASLTQLIINNDLLLPLHKSSPCVVALQRQFLAVLGQCTNLQVLHYKNIRIANLGTNELGSKEVHVELCLSSWVITLVHAVQRMREVHVEGYATPVMWDGDSYEFLYDVKNCGYNFEWRRYPHDGAPWPPSDQGKEQLDLAWNALKNPDKHHEDINQNDLRDAYEGTTLRIFGEGRSDIANNPFFVSGRTRSQAHTIINTEKDHVNPPGMDILRQSRFNKLRCGSDGESIEIHFDGFRVGSDSWVRLNSLLNPEAPDWETQHFVARLCLKFGYWCNRGFAQRLTVNPRLLIEPVQELAWENHALEKKYVDKLKILGVRVDNLLERRRRQAQVARGRQQAQATQTGSEGPVENRQGH